MVVAVIVMIVCGWLLWSPEDSWAVERPHSNKAPSVPLVSPLMAQRSNLDLSMKVRHVDWATLEDPAQERLLRRFRTEIAEGIAIIVGHGLLPANVTVKLQPEADIVTAIIRPPSTVESTHLQTTIRAGANDIAEGVVNSLMMMRGIEDISSGEITVSDVDVRLVVEMSSQAEDRRLRSRNAAVEGHTRGVTSSELHQIKGFGGDLPAQVLQ
eukprot:SRR837773.9691.p1 GENE.SRR837773.9691~~SRR837773.9691.p1  ORF type:complete len:212 (+),score=29.83 SRR837773.9691:13-648(+)